MDKKFFPVSDTELSARSLSSNGGFCLLNEAGIEIQDVQGGRSGNRYLLPCVFVVLPEFTWNDQSAWVLR